MKRKEEILIQCIEDIKAGKASLEDCLERYPDMRHELEPLLKIALSIKETPDVKPSDAFKVRARVNLMEYIHAGQTGKIAGTSESQSGRRRGWFVGVTRAIAITIATILIIAAAGTGTAYASQSSLPGDNLYSVKLATEQFQRIFTFDDADEVELELQFASTRLDELEKIVSMPVSQSALNNGIYNKVLTITGINSPDELVKTYTTQSERIAQAVAGYERNLNLAITKAEQLEDGEIPLEKVAMAILSHLNRLDEIEDKASEVNREFVTNSKAIAINGHIQTLQKLAKRNPAKANELNLQAMQGRLERAELEAARGNGKSAEEALQELEKLRRFGQEIPTSNEENRQAPRPVDGPNSPAPTEQQGTPSPNNSQTPQETGVTTKQPNNEQGTQGQQQSEQSNTPTESPPTETTPNKINNNTPQSTPNGADSGTPGTTSPGVDNSTPQPDPNTPGSGRK